MPYEEMRPMDHHLILEDRERLTVSGVEEVESFDENLHIEKLSLDGGDLKVEGMVESLTYEEDRGRRGSFLSRLLG